jgi:cysteine desulfurase/selenocysteine lyase
LEYPFTNYLEDFPLISKKGIIYLDSITKTLFPKPIWNNVINFYDECGVAPRRGAYKLTLYASQELEKTKNEIARLINSERENIFFSPNRYLAATTVLLGYPWKKGDKIIVSDMEHHSILIPALVAKKNHNLDIITIGRKNDWEFNIEEFENKIDKNCRFVIVTLSPMILGVKNPLEEVIKIAQDYGCYVFSDCSRAVVHSEIDFKKSNCDVMLFSGCVALTGLDGVSFVACNKQLLEELTPIISGGGAVSEVTTTDFKPSAYPEKLEPGLINMGSIVGLGEAIRYLRKIGFEKIRKYNKKLLEKMQIEIKNISKLKYYGPEAKYKANPVISFNVQDINSHDVALFLDDIGKIAVRSGMQCSYPLTRSLNKEGLIQLSLHFYNPPEIIEKVVETLNLIISELS